MNFWNDENLKLLLVKDLKVELSMLQLNLLSAQSD